MLLQKENFLQRLCSLLIFLIKKKKKVYAYFAEYEESLAQLQWKSNGDIQENISNFTYCITKGKQV